MTNPRFKGVELLYTEKFLEILSNTQIAIVGVGGVGSWAAESLARSGVGKLTLIDLDEVCLSNTNRQVHTLENTVGQTKVLAMANRLKLINPQIKITCIEDFYTPSNSEEIFNEKFDFIIDCIDSLQSKCHLIAQAYKKNIPIITVGAAGGKKDLSLIKVTDLNKSYKDRLLSRVRKKLRLDFDFPKNRKPYGVHCVFSPEEVDLNSQNMIGSSSNCNNGLGTASFITGAFGFYAASTVLNQLYSDYERN